MKNLLTRALTLAVMLFAGASLFAQQMPQLPVDKDVRIGRLPNGLTYYIRHNEKPKGQADFYIAQKVGSILEEDNQRGLAHFLEHMCFNGTTSFPGNTMIAWLEKNGVKFGENLNAYTAVDQTVYHMTNVPVAKESVQDTVLLVLHDWANDLLLDPEEINKERGVIHEEWRRSMAGQMRILEKILPTIYQGERYGYRLPIGIMEVVDNFEPQALRDYYETWYRPDQQGIIVVGDIDVDRIEGKIKEMFSSIEMPENPKERVYFPVSDNKGTIYAMGSDKEQQIGMCQIMFKTDAMPKEFKNTPVYLITAYINGMISTMLNQRLSDMTAKPDAPFAQAGVSYGNFFVAKTKDNLGLTVVAKGNDIRPGFEAAYRELLRAARGGFTQSEYDRARTNYMSSIETSYNNRADRRNGSFVNEYVENFLNDAPIPSFEDEYALYKQIVPNITVDAINKALASYITPDNRVFMGLFPENDAFVIPSDNDIADVIAKVEAENIEPFVDNVKTDPLIEKLSTPGSIISEKHNDLWDATEITLSNGIEVVVKATKFKEDEILISGSATGGMSILPENMAPSQMLLSEAIGAAMGLGSYTSTELPKYLTGKVASMAPSFGTYGRSFGGSAAPRDLATAFELLYMYFTAPNFNQEEFAALQNTLESILANQESSPQYIFGRDLRKSSYKAAALQSMDVETVKAANLDQIREIYAKMTANAADFKFTIVGNVDLDVLRPLLEQYVATLPVNPEKSISKVVINPDYEMIQGKTESTFTTKMETPQVWTFVSAFGTLPYNAKNRYLAQIAGEIIGSRYNDTVREEMGATYSIGASGSMGRYPEGSTAIQTAFPMKPEMKKEVLDFIANEFVAIQSNVKEDELQKQIEYLLKNYQSSLDRNGTWLGAISTWQTYGTSNLFETEKILKSITIKDVENFVKDLMKCGNYRVVTLDPEK